MDLKLCLFALVVVTCCFSSWQVDASKVKDFPQPVKRHHGKKDDRHHHDHHDKKDDRHDHGKKDHRHHHDKKDDRHHHDKKDDRHHHDKKDHRHDHDKKDKNDRRHYHDQDRGHDRYDYNYRPRPPVIGPRDFFSVAKLLPFDLYDNYMCCLMALPPLQYGPSNDTCSFGLGVATPDPSDPDQQCRLEKLKLWLMSKGRLNTKSKVYYDWYDDRWHRRVSRAHKSPDDFLHVTRNVLLEGIGSQDMTDLESFLEYDFSTCDIASLIRKIYGNGGCFQVLMKAVDDAKMFYVSSYGSSTMKFLGESDLRRLLINTVLAANGLDDALRRHDYPVLKNILRTLLLDMTLPFGYSRRKREAVQRMLMDLHGWNLDGNQCHRILDTHMSYFFDDERFIYDINTVCYALKGFYYGSPHCGIRHAVKRMADYLGCAGQFPPQPVRPGENGTSVISTTTATTPTTTSTTTTTIQPVLPGRCGISGMASGIATVSRSTLFTVPRIVGGAVTGSCRVYPWMVYIAVGDAQFCGGVILDETHILTAAHCTTTGLPLKVTVGEYNRKAVDGTEQMFDIDLNNGVFAHEGFDADKKINDIAVLKLDTPIDFTRPCAEPVCLDPNAPFQSGQSCVVAGWGVTQDLGLTTSDTLQSVSLPVFNGAECEATFPNMPADHGVTDAANQLCAGRPGVGQADSCGGDSGSPLMCQDQTTSRWVAVGIVSFGYRQTCGRPDTPGVYTRVASFMPWIVDQISK